MAGLPPPSDELAAMTQQHGISDIFYYFESFTDLKNNRTVGRKIGVLQEIIIRKYLERSAAISDRMLLERPVVGVSGATHKLEFVVCAVADRLRLARGQSVDYGGIEMELTEAGADAAVIAARWVMEETGRKSSLKSPIKLGGFFGSAQLRERFRAEGLSPRLTMVAADAVEISLLDPRDVLISIESKRVGAQRFSDSEKLGAGIQTIEKAKQAALVAVDLDLNLNRTVKAQAVAGQPRKYLSLVVLGNGVHWEAKSRKVLDTFVEHAFLVPDETIIRYCEYVRALADQVGQDFLPFFMKYFKGMTVQPPDDFAVGDADFVSITGTSGTSLLALMERHIAEINPAALL